jgi:hypothetical protein
MLQAGEFDTHWGSNFRLLAGIDKTSGSVVDPENDECIAVLVGRD